MFKKSNFWTKLANKFPVTVEKMAELDPNQKYLLGYHPHGAAGIGAFFTFATEATGFSRKFPGITPHLLSHSAPHFVSIVKEFLQTHGLGDVSPKNIRHVLRHKGHMAIIVIGGAKEALITHPEHNYLALKNRKGFVRMAIQTGYDNFLPNFFHDTAFKGRDKTHL